MTQTANDRRHASHRRRNFDIDVWVLLLFVTSAVATLWLPEWAWPKVSLAAVLIGWTLVEARQIKQRTDSKNQTLPKRRFDFVWVIAFTILAASIMYWVGVSSGAFRNDPQDAIWDKSAIEWLGVKIPTVIGQQVLLHLMLMPLLIRLLSNVSTSVWVAATIFAALHLPNPILVLMTFVSGVAWLAIYQQSQRLLPLVCSHLTLAVLAAAFGGEYLLNMRVGRSCLELFPSTVQLGSRTAWEFPCSTVGCAERLTQTNTNLVVEGWAFDAVHAEPPRAMAIRHGDNFWIIENVAFKNASSKDFSQSAKTGFVGEDCYAFVAKIPLSTLAYHQPFDLFASNQNGHWSQLGTLGELKKQTEQISHPVVLFPIEIDGRIDSIDQQTEGLTIIGWAADLQERDLAHRIIVQIGDSTRAIVLDAAQRSQRPDVAAAYSQKAFEQCGFEFKLPSLSANQIDRLRFFVQDHSGQLHPLGFTPTATQEISRLASRNVDSDGSIFR